MKTVLLHLSAFALAACALLTCFGHARAETPRGKREIVRELAFSYTSQGDGAGERAAALIAELEAIDPLAALHWKSVLNLWKTVDHGVLIHYGVLPDGLPDTDELCIVVLGYQLNADGTMRDELRERLWVALRSARKYPNAMIVCTGGPTASDAPEATEAGRMAAWLMNKGVDGGRILVEDRSLTTAQNAKFTYDLLVERCPQVKKLAIVSSDYHIAVGTLVFGAEAMLRAGRGEAKKMTVISNAAYRASANPLSVLFESSALMELAEDERADENPL